MGERQDGSLHTEPVLGVDEQDGAYVVRLGGELDLYNAEAVREKLFAICSDSAKRVIVDLAGVEFLDSTALGVLIEARTMMPNRKAFMLAAPGLETRRALQISGLDRHLSVHETVEDALAFSV